MLKVILAFIMLTSRLWAAESTLDQKIHNFEELSRLFREICFEPNGTFKENQVIIIPQSSLVKSAFNCNDQAIALAEYFKKLEAEVYAAGVEDCPAFDDPTAEIAGSTGEAIDRLNCPGKYESNQDCYGGIACNVMQSLVPGAALASKGLMSVATEYYKASGLDISKSSAYSSLKQCSKNTGNTCGMAIARGIWDNLYSTVVGLWKLVKMTGSGIAYLGEKVADKAQDGYYYVKSEVFKLLNKQEDQTSRRAIAATEISDSQLDKFLSDPFGFMKQMVSSMMEAANQHIKYTYGCEEWSGTAHLSTCLRPMQNFDCGTCQQKLNATCGVVSYFVGNFVTNYFCGGAAAVYTMAKTAASSKLTAKMTFSLASFPAKGVITGTGSIISRGGKVVLKSTIAAWNRVKHLPGVRTISEVTAELASKGTSAIGSASKLIFVESNTAILTRKLIGAYYDLSVKSTKLGYHHTMQAGVMIQNKVALLYPKMASIDKVEYRKQYLDALKVPEKDRKHFELKESQDGRAYMVDRRAIINESNITAAKDIIPESVGEEIVVTATRRSKASVDPAPEISLQVAGKLTMPQRVNAAEKLVGKMTDPARQKALERAHLIAEDKGFKQTTDNAYSANDLLEKNSLLRTGLTREEVRQYRKANNNQEPKEIFTAEEADLLLRKGIAGNAYGKSPPMSVAQSYQNTDTFRKASELNDYKELTASVADASQARALAMRFSAFKDMGFGLPGKTWKPYVGRLEKSGLYGKRVGWETSNAKGFARVRLDWDPVKGAHYNIEITEKVEGVSKTHKLAISFECQQRVCTEQEVLKMAEGIQ